ncbi:MAG TPA: alpha/beta hydrolase-fold protein [Flavobacterium sp.]|jgi:hypothetical protein|uniref:alpha/beta hydrolase n=1 Tax=Flavobacterium sp. TaxID=239 RepID=UPI001B4BA5FB|nr:alpha/beta hydrolase-fold protein [Flavobacterium sp.]MBP6145639.1 alpha/beta hydrolase [Flavobacterium sp.]MBP7182303.1 alpha/beta hydrolase [Flavobacterium sp.]MBP7318856.1 alpha/beta hydrolase [Flavobacterium sp.]MBP8887137.1 alpha/beta hydrolase [Flavobacterium sp.]HRL71829.1 alpha/beta hydrolase-fold protein [Flavobacterium sp.]
MKKFLLIISLSFCFPAFSQISTDTMVSRHLNENRIITVSLPASYHKNKEKKYPLLVLLDGDYLFNAFYGALSYGNYWDEMPETIIVGIHQNKNNERESDCEIDDATGHPIEKGLKFFDFIATELLPNLEKKYRITPFKTIAGHDLTASYLNLFLYKESSPFSAYISLSPELANGMEAQIPKQLSKTRTPVFYYQSYSDKDLKEYQEGIKVLHSNILTIKNENLHYKQDEFKDASHYSLVLHSIPNALYHIFESYQAITPLEYNEKIVVLPSNYVSYLTKKYDNMEKYYGVKIPVRMSDFNAIESAILKNKMYNELEELSIVARKNYPKTMLADYELAVMFEQKGDLKRAAKYYQDAFLKDEVGQLTKDMMFEKSDSLKKSFAKKGKETKQTETIEAVEEKK